MRVQFWIKIIGIFLFLLSGDALIAQSKSYTLSGTVVEDQKKEPIPYATVAAFSIDTNEMLSGTTTLEDGSFELRVAQKEIFLEVSFIGFENKRIDDLNFEGRRSELGIINMESNTEILEEAEVTAERSMVEFKLDKRVFNVGKDIASTGMGALEVLENVPSVDVNIEGQVSLRGSSGVQILINGKPSVLTDEGGALGSITSDMIESIEVITNPSAKYEAEGTAGIINIILKKEEKKGLNGSVSLNTGIPDNHSVGASLNLRTEKFNFFTQFGAGYRSLPRFRESINENLADFVTIRSDGLEFRNEEFYNITLGTDYYINELNTITLSGSFAYEIEDQPSETEFELFAESDVPTSRWRREETTSATNPKYQYDLQYQREFKNNEDHQLLISTQGRFFGKELSSEFRNIALLDTEVDPNQRTETEFYRGDYTFKLDYTNPLTEQITIETGALYEINDVGNEFAVFNEEDGVFVPDSGFTNNFEFDQKVLGVYGTASFEKEKWGVKLGLRAENTDLVTLLTNTGEENDQNYTNLFPTFHTSYKFSPLFQLQAGYSRRIFRPRLWDLNPFFNIRNNYNIRMGNPQLQPEFADSYELTGVVILEKASLNSSIYYLHTEDVVERITFTRENTSITMPENIGTNDRVGFEFNGKYTPMKWLTLNGDFNFGYFQRRGVFEDQNFDFTGDQWSASLMTKLKLSSSLDLELRGDYRSRVKTVQGNTSGFAFANAGLRKKFWKGKLVVNASVRDIFASRIRESFVYRQDFFLYDFSQRGTFFTLGLSYGFGKGEAMAYTGRRR